MGNDQIMMEVITKYDKGLKKVVQDGDRVVATFEKTSKVGKKLTTTLKNVTFAAVTLGNGMKTIVPGAEKISQSFKKVDHVTRKTKEEAKNFALAMEHIKNKATQNKHAQDILAASFEKSASKTKALQMKLDMQSTALDNNKKATEGLQKSFMGLGFSMLFGGMAMKRIFQTIATAGVSAFKRVIETTDNNSSALQRLGVWWEYLKFTVGSAINRALEPLMPWLIRIISWASEFIQKHPEEVFWGLVTAVTAFTALMVGGQVLLAMTA
ncbi:MAG: hypothetical protein U9O94_03995, partial [Nanoarchaeota archaeon]|nr:hypothetical protein [Nanoarchaeota archaeon]